jgi:hypothetical protein
MPVMLQKLQISILFEICALLSWLRSIWWWFRPEVWGQHVGPVFKGKEIQIHHMLCNIPEEGLSHLLSGRILKSRKVLRVVVIKLGGFKNSISVHFFKFTLFCFSIWCPVCRPDTVLLPENFLYIVKQCLGWGISAHFETSFYRRAFEVFTHFCDGLTVSVHGDKYVVSFIHFVVILAFW